MKSIVQDFEDARCYVCGSTRDLECHHILHGSANRRIAESTGLTCLLCRTHHTGKFGVHSDPILNRKLEQAAQMAFEKTHTRAEWMELFRKNYLD